MREILINVDDPERFLESMKRVIPVKGYSEIGENRESCVRAAAEYIEETEHLLLQKVGVEAAAKTVSIDAGVREGAVLHKVADVVCSAVGETERDLYPLVEFCSAFSRCSPATAGCAGFAGSYASAGWFWQQLQPGRGSTVQ